MLPPDTQRLWEFLRGREELRGFFRAERDKFETELAAEARAGQLRGE